MHTAEPGGRFGDVLRRHRTDHGLTQEELAERAGLSARGVQDLERGLRRAPHPDTIRRLAEALQLDEDECAVFLGAVDRALPPSGAAAPFVIAAPPLPLSSFVGRERELAQVQRLLSRTRLVTLAGPGGVGKTRLALEAARRLGDDYPDGFCLVELAALADPRLVPQAVADVLGVRDQTGRTLRHALADALKHRQLLMVLDNCEHLVEACAELAEALLRACPELRILATSREPLLAEGEITWRVPPLSIPDVVHAQPVDDETQRSEAERLFVERARSVLPEFVLTERSGRAVADVCRRLDGLPLAIELAAARVKVLSCEQIVQRLEDPFRLLTSISQRTAPRRQQTLRAVFDWSYGLLNQREQAMFKHLSVFAGGCAVGALESVGADIGIPESEVLDIVAALVDKSLVLAGQQAGGARYRLLETMREYGRNRLVEAGEETAARDRHAAFFLTLVAQAEPHLGVHSHDQGVWIAELERERENLRAVLHWVVDHDDAAAALRMGAALWPFWLNRGYLSEGAAWLEAILAVSAGTLSAERSTVLLGASSLASARGDYAQVVAYATERLALEREIGDPLGEASALNSLGLAALNQGDLEGARAHVAEGLAIRRDEGDEHGVCASLNNLGMVATYANDLETAVALLGEAVAMDRRWGYDPDTAIPLLHLGEAVLALGDHRRARACLTESLSIFTQIGNRLRTMSCLEAFAGVASKQSDPERAARLLGAADALHEVMGASQAPMARTRKDNLVAAVRSALGGDAYAECWAAGRAMSLEQGVAHALEPDGRAH